jgi:hypothetical protein
LEDKISETVKSVSTIQKDNIVYKDDVATLKKQMKAVETNVSVYDVAIKENTKVVGTLKDNALELTTTVDDLKKEVVTLKWKPSNDAAVKDLKKRVVTLESKPALIWADLMPSNKWTPEV